MNNTQPHVVVENSDRGEDWMSNIVTDQQQGNDTVRVWTDAEWTTEASRGPLTTAQCHALTGAAWGHRGSSRVTLLLETSLENRGQTVLRSLCWNENPNEKSSAPNPKPRWRPHVARSSSMVTADELGALAPVTPPVGEGAFDPWTSKMDGVLENEREAVCQEHHDSFLN